MIVLYITNKMEHFSVKSGCAPQMVKRLKEDWLNCSVVITIAAYNIIVSLSSFIANVQKCSYSLI